MRGARTALRGLLCVIVVVLAACTDGGGEPRSPGPAPRPSATVTFRSGGKLSFGVIGSPATLDPYSPVASDLTRQLVRPVYPSLYRFLPDGRAVPYLAAELDEEAKGAKVTLTEARWSNGQRITARDVVASVVRATEPSGFSELKARALDRSTVEFTGSVDDWNRTLARAAFVLPGGRATRLSGGPLVIDDYVEGLKVSYRRNPRWWGGGSALLDRVDVVFVQQLDIMLELLEKGRLDAAAVPWAVNVDQRLDERDLNHQEVLGWESIELDLDPDDLSRAERERVAAGIDRGALVEGFVRSGGRVSNTLHPGPGPGGAAGPFGSLPSPTEGSGTIQMAAPFGDELLTLSQRVIQVQLIELGYEVDLATIEPELLYGAWEDDLPTDATLRRRAGAPGWPNDPSERRELEAFPLFHVETLVAWTDGVGGLEPNPTIDGPLWNVEAWGLTE